MTDTPITDAAEAEYARWWKWAEQNGHLEGALEQAPEEADPFWIARKLERENADLRRRLEETERRAYEKVCVEFIGKEVYDHSPCQAHPLELLQQHIADAELRGLKAAAAWKWGYEYLQDRMESIGRDGWAHDCDDEILARLGQKPTEGQ